MSKGLPSPAPSSHCPFSVRPVTVALPPRAGGCHIRVGAGRQSIKEAETKEHTGQGLNLYPSFLPLWVSVAAATGN